jgi:hypothetical protein
MRWYSNYKIYSVNYCGLDMQLERLKTRKCVHWIEKPFVKRPRRRRRRRRRRREVYEASSNVELLVLRVSPEDS